MKTVKVGAKGRLTLPVEALRAMNVRKGAEFVLVQEGDRIVLAKAGAVGKHILDETQGFSALASRSFARVWDDPVDDEAWDD